MDRVSDEGSAHQGSRAAHRMGSAPRHHPIGVSPVRPGLPVVRPGRVVVAYALGGAVSLMMMGFVSSVWEGKMRVEARSRLHSAGER